MRPVEMQAKPSIDDPKFRYQSAVESGVKTTELADRALDTKITISTRELLAVSPDVRRHVKDLVTKKKVAAHHIAEDEDERLDTYLTDFNPDATPVYLEVSQYEASSAVPSLPLRVIYPSFGHGIEPECILDGGAHTGYITAFF